MVIQVQDTLLDPLNRPIADAILEVVSVVNGEEVLLCATASTTTDSIGTVAFDLLKGDYRIYLQQSVKHPKLPIGYVKSSIFDTIGSPASLNSLITETL